MPTTRTFVSCTIRRRRTITNINCLTFEEEGTRIETAECDKPLFTDIECATGVCRGCAGGWEKREADADDGRFNEYVSDAERQRAAAAHQQFN